MNVCIPVNEDKGLQSQVCAHFGSAPLFMIVDTDNDACRAIPNHNQHHGHGMCMPLASLQGERLDGVVVGGIGMGALNKLTAAGLQVYVSQLPTVEGTVSAFKAGSLKEMTAVEACAQHGAGPHGHGPHGHGEGGPHGAGLGRGSARS